MQQHAVRGRQSYSITSSARASSVGGEWCCGAGDCFIVPKERVMMTGEGYVVIQGPLAGVGPQFHEVVPFSEAQPSPDGEFWRCRRPNGSRRCFFAPPPST
jgi:hypothetical protein